MGGRLESNMACAFNLSRLIPPINIRPIFTSPFGIFPLRGYTQCNTQTNLMTFGKT